MKKSKEEEDYFEIESLLDKKIINGKVFYKVKWKNYPISDSTWEPLSNFKGNMDIVHQFEKEYTYSHKDNINRAPHQNQSLITNFTNKRKEEPKIKKEKERVVEKAKEKKQKVKKEPSLIDRMKEGRFGIDIPDKIISAKRHVDLPKELFCEIQWKKRKDNTQPLNSFYLNSEIKKHEPMLLINFYEEHLVFPECKNKK